VQGATGASGYRVAAGNRTGRDRSVGGIGGRLGFVGSDDEGPEGDGEGDGWREGLLLAFPDFTLFYEFAVASSLYGFQFVVFSYLLD
jgi:hypothetical protein